MIVYMHDYKAPEMRGSPPVEPTALVQTTILLTNFKLSNKLRSQMYFLTCKQTNLCRPDVNREQTRHIFFLYRNTL